MRMRFSYKKKCSNAQNSAATALLLKDLKWSCSRCPGLWEYDHFMGHGSNEVEWFSEYDRVIVKPGVLRICHENKHTYRDCVKLKAKKCFLDRTWRNRHTEDAVCVDCLESKKTHPCQLCAKAKPKDCFTDDTWKKRQDRPPVCIDCIHAIIEHVCRICAKVKAKSCFTARSRGARLAQNPSCLTCASDKTTSACRKCTQVMTRQNFIPGSARNRRSRDPICFQCKEL